jgi:type IV fimbrial biogenesis protein FimT
MLMAGRERGFTIIELVIVIAVIGVITTVGLPSLTEVLRDNGVRARAEGYSEGLQLARIEAIQRNATVDFVPDGAGWSVRMVDPDDGSEIVLRRQAATSSDAPYTVAASLARVSFTGSGRASTGDFSADFGFTGESCEADGGDIRCLRVRLTPRGAVRMCDPATSSPDPRACG